MCGSGSPTRSPRPRRYNDGQWHHVVGTQGATGMALYVDGARSRANGQTNNQGYNGYWRVGGDNLGGWPNQPTSNFFDGTIDDVAVYPTALTLTKVDAHYAASGPHASAASRPVGHLRQVRLQRLADRLLAPRRDAPGTTAADASDNGTNGQYFGGVTKGAARCARRHGHRGRPSTAATATSRRSARPAAAQSTFSARAVVQDHHHAGRQADRLRQRADRHQRRLRQARLHDQRRPPGLRRLQRQLRHASPPRPATERRQLAPRGRHAGPVRA